MKNEPAFPTKNYQGVQPIATGYSEGISMRDYFAAKAMQSLITGSFTDVGQKGIEANRGANKNIEDLVVETAYEYSDAMLKAREQ